MTKSLYRHKRFRKRITEEMGLQMFPENRYWRCWRDVQRQSVPQSRSSNRKSSIADGWTMGACDENATKQSGKRWRAKDWWNSSARYGGAVWS